MKKKILLLGAAFSLAASVSAYASPAEEPETSGSSFWGSLLQSLINGQNETDSTEEAGTDDDRIGGGSDILLLPTVEETEEVPAIPAGDVIALDDQDISIEVEDYVSVRQDEGFVYIHTMYDESIPYVIIGFYDDAYPGVVDDFSALMQETYDPLDIDFMQTGLEIDGREYVKVIYRYQISGYDAVDTRLFCELNGRSYMFGTKEVPELDMVVEEGYLESVAASAQMLAGGYGDYDLHVDAENFVLKGEEEPETETPEAPEDVEWFDEADAPYAGTWVPFEDGFRFYLPSEWTQYELTDEVSAAGGLYLAGDGTKPDITPFFSVSYSYDEGVTALEDYEDILADIGYSIDGITTVNDIECLLYSSQKDDIKGELFLYPGGDIAGLAFVGVAENYSSDPEYLDAILSSLMRYEE